MLLADHRAVMANRVEPPDSLEFFPTPPWATRALCELLLARGIPLNTMTAWDPAAGEGHMVGPLEEYFADVEGSDIHDYGRGFRVHDFLATEDSAFRADILLTNPPFRLALPFATKMIATARRVAAVLVRTTWLEGGERYRELFSPIQPTLIAQFCDRVPMVKGRWDPNASTATGYAWVVWVKRGRWPRTEFTWIPPGAKARHSRPEDIARYSNLAEAPLLDGIGP